MEAVLEINVTNRRGAECTLDQPFERIRAHVDEFKPAILRGVLTPDEAMHVRRVCRECARATEPSNPGVFARVPNFHRVDDNPPKASVPKVMHLYTFFYWNEDSSEVAPYFRRLNRIRNILSGLAEHYAMDAPEDGLTSIPSVQQYPRGGGFMRGHVDPAGAQRVVLSCQLSQMGADFAVGGLWYRTPGGDKIGVDPHTTAGDVFVFHPQLAHGVDPVDPDATLDWNADDGRWMMFSGLTTLSSLNGIRDGSAGQPAYA